MIRGTGPPDITGTVTTGTAITVDSICSTTAPTHDFDTIAIDGAVAGSIH